jgi:hypothetical protein
MIKEASMRLNMTYDLKTGKTTVFFNDEEIDIGSYKTAAEGRKAVREFLKKHTP